MSETIELGHGSGGVQSLELIEREILTRFGDGPLAGLADGAVVDFPHDRLVMSTDSFVVQPLEFPGGNIGHLAVHGTVNDVSVAGGRPRFLSLALILEEGLPMATLRRVLDAVRDAAAECGVQVVTGDTKVVRKGQADGMYINTTGVGEAMAGLLLGVDRIRCGDAVLVSGPLGDHGMAVMAAREGIDIRNGPSSDTAPVHLLVQATEDLGASVRFLRDPTRGGLSAVLNEAVRGRDFGITLQENALPFSDGARAVAEMLGMDLLQVASEGRVAAVVALDSAEEVLARWRRLPAGRGAVRVGEVGGPAGRVTLQTLIGSRRLVDVPHGELLPRIC